MATAWKLSNTGHQVLPSVVLQICLHGKQAVDGWYTIGTSSWVVHGLQYGAYTASFGGTVRLIQSYYVVAVIVILLCIFFSLFNRVQELNARKLFCQKSRDDNKNASWYILVLVCFYHRSFTAWERFCLFLSFSWQPNHRIMLWKCSSCNVQCRVLASKFSVPGGICIWLFCTRIAKLT